MRTAEHGTGGDGRFVEDDDGDAGTERKVGRVADGNAFDVGDEVEKIGQGRILMQKGRR